MVDTLGEEITITIAESVELDKLAKAYSAKELHLDETQFTFLHDKLGSKKWRMNNLYTIRDKDNNKRILTLNASQQLAIYKFSHNKKIILKSRQQGISTLFLAYYLDDCIFKPGFQAGIQSYGIDEAIKLQKRAMLMWEELDTVIKEILGITLVSSNARGMTFSNGSILKIGNFRGDTLQGLHVSELGKIAKKYPDKAKELKTGAFQAVSTNSKITIESTAEGQSGLFYEMWIRATKKQLLGKPLTPLDFQPIFLSWLIDPDCYLEDKVEPESWHLDYEDKLVAELSIELSDGQRNWLYSKLDELQDDFDQEYPASPDRAFRQSVEGTYFHHQYSKLLDEKRLGDFPFVPLDITGNHIEVNVAWDLGVNDEMVLLFQQTVNGVPRVINAYHNTSQGIEFYVNVLKLLSDKHGYKYGTHILPHDIEVFEMSSGMTRTQTLRKLGITRLRILPKLKFMDSIEVCRNFINMCNINEYTADQVSVSIQQYRKKYDKQLGVYLSVDVHDIHSNYMAALRYLAQGLGISRLTRQVKPLTITSNRIKRAYQGASTSSSTTTCAV